MVAGIAPAAWYAFRSGTGGPALGHGGQLHLWKGLPLASSAAPVDGVGIVFGLGFVLSFSYWCTDFVLMQRAFTARSDSEARQVPLWAGFGKLVFSLLVVVPGLAAARLLPGLGHTQRFDQALPALMAVFYSPAMLGLGLTALAASLMSGLAANVSAFAAVWTEDIYRRRIRRRESDRHYLAVGRIASIVAILISMSASYINFLFSDLMEHVQLIFSVSGAPFWAIFLLGMTTRRTTGRGATAGFLGGTAIALLHLLAFSRGWIVYGSVMTANFRTAMYGFCTAMLLGWLVSVFEARKSPQPERRLVLQWGKGLTEVSALLWILAVLLLVSCISLNLIWR
jgi:SSS family solute:Na+ symporter